MYSFALLDDVAFVDGSVASRETRDDDSGRCQVLDDGVKLDAGAFDELAYRKPPRLAELRDLPIRELLDDGRSFRFDDRDDLVKDEVGRDAAR